MPVPSERADTGRMLYATRRIRVSATRSRRDSRARRAAPGRRARGVARPQPHADSRGRRGSTSTAWSRRSQTATRGSRRFRRATRATRSRSSPPWRRWRPLGVPRLVGDDLETMRAANRDFADAVAAARRRRRSCRRRPLPRRPRPGRGKPRDRPLARAADAEDPPRTGPLRLARGRRSVEQHERIIALCAAGEAQRTAKPYASSGSCWAP